MERHAGIFRFNFFDRASPSGGCRTCAVRSPLAPDIMAAATNEGGGLQYVPQPHPDVLGYVVLHLRAQEQQQQFLGQLWGFRHWSRFQSQARDGPEVGRTGKQEQ